MKQRLTYLLRDGDAELGVEQVRVSDSTLAVDGINAAKEHRITVGFDELPQELRLVLNQCHELRIRWASSRPFSTVSPLVSRITPGLHVYYTPRRNGQDAPICQMLQRLFGSEIDCASVEQSFISLPILSERFSTSASMQYYSLLPSLNRFVTYLEHAVHESLRSQLSTLLHIDQIDIDCDIISHACILNAYWAGPIGGKPWTEQIGVGKMSDTLEVGVLSNEKPLEPEELSLSGVLTVVGDDDKPKPTRFSFPSRHHPIKPSDHSVCYSSSIKRPAGLHPTLQITFPRGTKSLQPPAESCALHTFLTLPSTIFTDKYQLQDALFLASQNLINLRSVAGETDLEAPNWATSRWGSSVLLELAHPRNPDSRDDAEDWTVSIPLHLRYLNPASNASGMAAAQLPWPVVFWACTAEEGTKMSVNPFDRTNLGYDGLFGPRTMFYHIPPEGSGASEGLVETIPVPVLDLEKAWYVEIGTILAVVVGFAWVTWKLVSVAWKSDAHFEAAKEE